MATLADLWDETAAPAAPAAPAKTEFANRLQAARDAYRAQFKRDMPINSTTRTREEQQRLYDEAQAGKPGVYMPVNPADFPDKKTFHEDAADIPTSVPEDFLNQHGIHRPLGSKDPVHAVAMPTGEPRQTGATLADLWESTPAKAEPTKAAAPAPAGEPTAAELEAASKPGFVAPASIRALRERLGQRTVQHPPIAEALGPAEAAISAAAAPAAQFVGAAQAIPRSIVEGIRTGQAPGPIGQQMAEQFMQRVGPNLAPQTETGKAILGGLGQTVEESKFAGMPILGMGGQLGALAPAGTVARQAAGAAQESARTVATKFGSTAQAISEGIARATEVPREALGLRQELQGQFAAKRGGAPVGAPGAPAPGRVSAGAAATTDAATVQAAIAGASPELRAVVQGIPVDRVNLPTLTRHIEADSLPVPVRLTEGQASGDVVRLSNEQNMRGKNPELAQRFNEQNTALRDNLTAIRESAAPDVYGTKTIENSQAIIDAYKALDDARSTEITSAYNALRDAAGGDFPVNGQKIAADSFAKLHKELKTEFLPPAIERQLTRFAEGERMSFEQFEALRTNLAAEIRKAERSGDGNAAFAAGIVREQMEKLPLTTETAALKELADRARGLAKARFDQLKRDPAYRAAVDDTVPADKFFDRFVINGINKNVQTMADTLGRGTPAQQNMAAGTVNWLKQKAGIVDDQGNFSQAGFNKAIEQLDRVNNFNVIFSPESAHHVKTLGNVARYTQAQPRGSFVNNSNTTVSLLAERAKGMAARGAEKAVNYAVPGLELGTAVREAKAARAERQAIRKMLEPGAGIQK